jgi:hypothetical protein
VKSNLIGKASTGESGCNQLSASATGAGVAALADFLTAFPAGFLVAFFVTVFFAAAGADFFAAIFFVAVACFAASAHRLATAARMFAKPAALSFLFLVVFAACFAAAGRGSGCPFRAGQRFFCARAIFRLVAALNLRFGRLVPALPTLVSVSAIFDPVS